MRKRALNNDLLLRQIRVNRWQNGEIEKALEILEKANREIKASILKTNGIATKKRYNEIIRDLDFISARLRDSIDDLLNNTDFIESEIKAQNKILAGYGIRDAENISINALRSSVQFAPFAESGNYKTFLESLQTGFYNTWDNAIRTGYLTSETTAKICRDVIGEVAGSAQLAKPGAMHALRVSIERNTRTYLQSMATITRERVFLENEKYFRAYEWVSTLDRRTCLVCGKLDGEKKESIKDFENPPLHYNCRCVILPVLKGFDRDYERASENGPVSSKTDFESWLREQPESIKEEILGPSRYRIYKESGERIGQFVADNQVLTLDQLNALYE